jgi:tetratricopeptide (TPR) repeat protein
MANNQSKSMKKAGLLLLMALAAVFLPVGAGAQSTQAIDPFYLKMFETGESSFLAKDYAKAVKDLEVSLFGLSSDRTRATKAAIYLALSCENLGNKAKSLRFLAQAVDIIGNDTGASLGLDESVWKAYESLKGKNPVLPDLQSDPGPGLAWKRSAKPAEVVTPETAVSRAAVPDTDPARIRELERGLKTDPGNASIPYELASVYLYWRAYGKAEGLMTKLLKRDPNEALAVYVLAKARFFQQDYRAALQGFHQAISPAFESRIPRETVLKSTIYLVLCLHHLGQDQSLASYLDYLSLNVPPADLDRLIAEEGLPAEWSKLGSKAE